MVDKKPFEKSYPFNFSDDIIDIIKVMTLPNTFRTALLGSSALKIQYASDYDTYTEINKTITTTQEFQEVILKMMNYRLKDFEKMRRQDKPIYIGDIKAGIVYEYQLIPDDASIYNWKQILPSIIKKNNQLYKSGIIDNDEYNEGKRLLLPTLTYADILIAKNETNYQIVRWKPHEILKGDKIYRKKLVKLNECLYQKSRVKIDCISWVNGYRYTEISMIYKFYIDGVIIFDENPNLDRILKEQVLVLTYNGNYMKMSKRMLSLERFKEKPNEKTIKALFILFNSDLGRLNQITSDIENYIYMIEHFSKLKDSPLPIYRFEFESNQFKNRLSQIVNRSYQKQELEIVDLIDELDTAPIDLNILNKLRDMLNNIVQEDTLIFLKEAKLYPVNSIYLPKEEPQVIERSKISPYMDTSANSGDAVVGTLSGGKLKFSRNLVSGKKYCMPVKELITEHKRIVKKLSTCPKLKNEYNIQKKELKKYEGMGKHQFSGGYDSINKKDILEKIGLILSQ